MALLNPPQVMPAVMRVILEAVGRSDARYASEDDVVAAIAPGEVGGAAKENSKDKGVVRDSFRALRTLDLVDVTDDVIAVSDDVLAALDHRGSLRAAWQQLLLRRVLEHPTAEDSLTATDGGERTAGVRDLVFALTWLLAQDAAGLALTWSGDGSPSDVQRLQAEQLGQDQTDWPFSNDTRFRTAQRWIVALGLGVSEQGAVRPSPMLPLRQTVSAMESGTHTIASFCDQIGESMPVLWPGKHRRRLTERIGRDPDPDVQRDGVDSSLAIALLALEAERQLKLTALSDAARLEFGAGSARPRSVSHVEVLG